MGFRLPAPPHLGPLRVWRNGGPRSTVGLPGTGLSRTTEDTPDHAAATRGTFLA
jgi:hypothetical protein